MKTATVNNQTFEIITNTFHAKKFANSWKYDNSILKEYSVDVELLYVPGGGKFKRGFFIMAYTQNEACKIGVERIKLRDGDKVISARSVSMGYQTETPLPAHKELFYIA